MFIKTLAIAQVDTIFGVKQKTSFEANLMVLIQKMTLVFFLWLATIFAVLNFLIFDKKINWLIAKYS